jgi:hypothetical protein
MAASPTNSHAARTLNLSTNHPSNHHPFHRPTHRPSSFRPYLPVPNPTVRIPRILPSHDYRTNTSQDRNPADSEGGCTNDRFARTVTDFAEFYRRASLAYSGKCARIVVSVINAHYQASASSFLHTILRSRPDSLLSPHGKENSATATNHHEQGDPTSPGLERIWCTLSRWSDTADRIDFAG